MKKRKFLSAVLIGALMISTVPFAAFAEDNEPIPDVLVEEGVTYLMRAVSILKTAPACSFRIC